MGGSEVALGSSPPFSSSHSVGGLSRSRPLPGGLCHEAEHIAVYS